MKNDTYLAKMIARMAVSVGYWVGFSVIYRIIAAKCKK